MSDTSSTNLWDEGKQLSWNDDFQIIDAINDLGVSLKVENIYSLNKHEIQVGQYTFNFTPGAESKFHCVISLVNDPLNREKVLVSREEFMNFIQELVDPAVAEKKFYQSNDL